MTITTLYLLIVFAAAVLVPLLDPRPRLRPLWILGLASLGVIGLIPYLMGLAPVGWLLYAVAAAIGPTWAWLRRPAWGIVALLRLAAPLHLVVGALWILLAAWPQVRLDGLPWIIKPLTAIHFHFAGFAAAHLAAHAIERLAAPRAGGWLLLGGVPALAIGFLVSPLLKLIAAGAIVAGMLILAGGSLRNRARLGAGRRWIVASWSGIVLGMVLSAIYAAGEFSGRWWLGIPTMIVSHGLLNGLVFAGCGAVGWRKEAACASA